MECLSTHLDMKVLNYTVNFMNEKTRKMPGFAGGHADGFGLLEIFS